MYIYCFSILQSQFYLYTFDIMKKLFIIVLAWIIGFYSFSLAWNEFTYENAKKIANEYITNSSFDENWQDKNPTLAWEGKFFYTESENPSYIEFKVSCDKNPDCGFIMVNFDGDDVAIPIASTSGNTPSEVLSAKNESKIEENTLYYFSPLEQYAESKVTGNISSINPQDDFWFEISEKNTSSLQEVQTKKNTVLKEKIESSKSQAKTFKKSVEFKKIKKELKEKKQTNGKEEVSFKYLDLAIANYTPPAVSSDKFVYGSTIYGTCNGKIPCYKQTLVEYNWVSCNTGCTPVAYAMVYWYYDRLSVAWNLLPWELAPTLNSTSIINMIESLWKNYLWTYCSGDEGLTTIANSTNWIQYAIDKWYSNSTATISGGNDTTIFSKIKTEIDASRPAIVNTSKHSFVVFWYHSSISSARIIRVNLWFWDLAEISSGYYWSNIDYNINAIYYDNSSNWVKSIIQIKLAN